MSVEIFSLDRQIGTLFFKGKIKDTSLSY